MLARARVVMVLLFALWVWLDPAQPALAAPWAIGAFASYVAMALVLLAVARSSWWFEHLSARPAFATDVVVFLVGLYATEAVTLDLFSVFITFFAFLVVASAVRWGECTTRTIAGLLVVCFLLAGLLVSARGLQLDLPKFARRVVYLSLLAALLIWFARGRPVTQAPRLVSTIGREGHDPLEEALRYAMSFYGASCGVVAWLDDGALRPGVLAAGLPSPELSALDPEAEPCLFDRARQRRLILVAERRLIARSNADDDGMLARLPVREGLSFPLASRAGRGRIVLGGISGLCSNDVEVAPAVAAEIGRAIDDEATGALAREVAMARLRTALAADLHDGVSQTLAGVQFRLKALAGRVSSGDASADEVDSIAIGVAAEQQHLRAMIEGLRRGTVAAGERELRAELRALVGPLAQQWQVAIELSEDGHPLLLPATAVYQVQQIVREGVANAVRHGQASRITIELGVREGGDRVLAIEDDGRGCPPGEAPTPRSITERAASLGATVDFRSAPGATRVVIALPGATT